MTHPVCPQSESIPLIDMDNVPVHCNVLWPTRAAALSAPRGDIHLTYLPACGHTYNPAFDAALMEYTQEYENSLHFSPHFQEYATALANGLIAKYDLYGKDIVEIGAGKGDFLIMLCAMSGNRGWGYDPSYVPEPGYTAPNVTFVEDFYTEKYIDQRADLIVCRHVLEHIEDPDAFLAQVRRAVGEQQSVVFFEVPNALWTLRRGGIWDVIYEHCSYYSPSSLAHLFRRHGFRVLAVNEVFGGQFLTIEATPAGGEQAADAAGDNGHTPDGRAAIGAEDLLALTADARAFAANYAAKRDEWRARLRALAAAGQRGVVWGAGSKGVTFLNATGAGEEIVAVVDINPRKQGKYVAGTGQRIVAPADLPALRPDFVIIMNANYRAEIGEMLAEAGVMAEILVA
ncbi:MAG: methyltransferase domain-containing protein [Candidatus Promineofilum sp.]|nr:methyltransferase domain-containing protein [Promineifilum sp.]MCW5862726.1 methyltransferase domain-containing protein [Anaerolineae bacterium]